MISPAQRKKAKELLAKHRGIGAESITDESVDLALMARTILLSECGPADSVNSYSAPLDTGSSTSSYTGDSGSYDSGSGCDS